MEKLGINPIQIVSYILIFFLLYFFTRKFVGKVLATTEERKRLIEEGLENAKQAELLKAQKLAEAEVEKKTIVQDAYTHANDIFDKAKTKETHLLEEAREKSKTLLSEASKELSDLREKNKEEGLKDAREIISLSIKKAFANVSIDKATEEKLIEEALNQLHNSK